MALQKSYFFGKLEKTELKRLKDLNFSEGFILFFLAILVLILGFYPNIVFDTIHVSVDDLIKTYYENLTLNSVPIK